MFVVTKGEERKNLFITRYEPSTISKIKNDAIKQPKIPIEPKIEKSEENKIEQKIN